MRRDDLAQELIERVASARELGRLHAQARQHLAADYCGGERKLFLERGVPLLEAVLLAHQLLDVHQRRANLDVGRASRGRQDIGLGAFLRLAARYGLQALARLVEALRPDPKLVPWLYLCHTSFIARTDADAYRGASIWRRRGAGPRSTQSLSIPARLAVRAQSRRRLCAAQMRYRGRAPRALFLRAAGAHHLAAPHRAHLLGRQIVQAQARKLRAHRLRLEAEHVAHIHERKWPGRAVAPEPSRDFLELLAVQPPLRVHALDVSPYRVLEHRENQSRLTIERAAPANQVVVLHRHQQIRLEAAAQPRVGLRAGFHDRRRFHRILENSLPKCRGSHDVAPIAAAKFFQRSCKWFRLRLIIDTFLLRSARMTGSNQQHRPCQRDRLINLAWRLGIGPRTLHRIWARAASRGIDIAICDDRGATMAHTQAASDSAIGRPAGARTGGRDLTGAADAQEMGRCARGLRRFAMPGIARLAVSAIAAGHRRRGFRRGNLDVTNRNKIVPLPRNKIVPAPRSLRSRRA